MRAVLDTNVLISALLTPAGAPARLLRSWRAGGYQLIVSAKLLDELERALAYPKLQARVSPRDAAQYVDLLRRGAELRADVGALPRVRSADPNDDYLISLAADARAAIVTGDRQLLLLSDVLPVYAPAKFLEMVGG